MTISERLTYTPPIRYLASAFVDAQSLVATPESVAQIAVLLRDEELLPSFAIQVMPPQMALRIHLTSPKQGFSVTLNGERFDLTLIPTDEDATNMQSLTAFGSRAGKILGKLTSSLKRVPHRLALVQEGITRLEPDELRRFFALPSICQKEPIEALWRYGVSIDRTIVSEEEPTNTVVTLAYPRDPGRGVRMDLDINTCPTRTALRFHPEGISEFYENAPAWHTEVLQSLAKFLEGHREN